MPTEEGSLPTYTAEGTSQRLTKRERLYLRDEIERLYARGRSFVSYPIRVVWLAEPSSEHTNSRQAQVAVMTSVAKRRFKHAVDRNRIKRMTRSAYRLSKAILWQAAERHHCTVHLALQSVAKGMPTYQEVEHAVQRAIARIVQELDKPHSVHHGPKGRTPQVYASREKAITSNQPKGYSKDPTQRLSLPVRLLSYPVKLYRQFISPLFPPSCRFTPTCSQYALEALRLHGALRGSWLALWRILRCNPFNSHIGYDPVPPRR